MDYSSAETRPFLPILAIFREWFLLASNDNPAINNRLFVGQGGVVEARERNSTSSYICLVCSERVRRTRTASAASCLPTYNIRLLPSRISAGCAARVRRPLFVLSFSALRFSSLFSHRVTRDKFSYFFPPSSSDVPAQPLVGRVKRVFTSIRTLARANALGSD